MTYDYDICEYDDYLPEEKRFWNIKIKKHYLEEEDYYYSTEEIFD